MDATNALIGRAKAILQEAQTGTVTPPPPPPPPPKPKYEGLTIPETVFEGLFLDPKLPADPNGAFTKWMAKNKFHHPVHKLVRDGDTSYLITGGGILRAKGGAVDLL